MSQPRPPWASPRSLETSSEEREARRRERHALGETVFEESLGSAPKQAGDGDGDQAIAELRSGVQSSVCARGAHLPLNERISPTISPEDQRKARELDERRRRL